MMKSVIRPEMIENYASITEVNDLAFGQKNEGRLILALRKTHEFRPELSLVAEVGGRIVGHILFYPIKIKSHDASYGSLCLAPMAVLPEYQKKGIGLQLVEEGLKRARKLGFKSVIVLGHAAYYPRFGFEPAGKWGIRPPFEVPDDAFMALELVMDGLKDIQGTVEYPPEFNDV
jgi:predicted N-acetyltransferase YhbS